MEIVSTMGSGSLGVEVDLDTLIGEIRNEVGDSLDVNFHSEGNVTIKFAKDAPAISIYRTGSFQIRGARGHDDLDDLVSQFLQVLTEIDFETGDVDFEEKTVVFMDELNVEFNLETLAIQLGLEHTEYEPEQFPGLLYRPPELKPLLLIFSSGNVLVVGTPEDEVAEDALRILDEEAKR